MKDRRGRPYVKKRCARCGHTELVRPAQRRCHVRKFGPTSYCCWGLLARAPMPVRTKKVTVAAAGAAEEAVVAERQARRPQDEAQKKLEHARTKVTELTRSIARLSTRLRDWERQATHYAKRASMTDAEVSLEREKRQAQQARRAKPARRGIKLGGA